MVFGLTEREKKTDYDSYIGKYVTIYYPTTQCTGKLIEVTDGSLILNPYVGSEWDSNGEHRHLIHRHSLIKSLNFPLVIEETTEEDVREYCNNWNRNRNIEEKLKILDYENKLRQRPGESFADGAGI